MGTSKKRINDKVKKMLEKTSNDSIENNIQKITPILLSNSFLLENFDEKAFENTILIVREKINSIKKMGYHGKSLKEISEDQISREELFEEILDEIEKNISSASKLLLKAFKIAMTTYLQGEDDDIIIFANLLFYHFIYLLLEEQLLDTLKDFYHEMNYQEIKDILKLTTDNILNKQIAQEIEKFVNRKVALSDLLQSIEFAIQNIRLGDF